MPTFQYEALDKSGKKIKNTVESASKSALLYELKQKGIFPYEISEVGKSAKKINFSFNFGKSVSVADIFFQLSMLIKSSIPLVEALKIVADNVKKQRPKSILLDISTSVSEGKRFSEAMAKHSKFFDEVHIRLIEASEKVGKLSDVLMDIAVYEEDRKKAFDKVKSAVVYPLTVLVIGLGVVGFLLSYVVPKMNNIFKSMNREIPPSTQFMIFMGNFIKDYGMFVVLALILIIVSLQYIYKKNKNVRLKIDKKIYSINFFKEALIGKVSHMISFLLAEGLPLTQAIALGSKTINNQFLQTNLEDVVEDIKSGKNFSHSAESKKIFPEIFVAAVKTGEKSGELSEILDRIGEFYSKRVEKYTATFISLIEPLFIVFIGVVVGFIVLSVMGPLFDLNTIVD